MPQSQDPDAHPDDLSARLDELGRRMDNGFNRVDARIDRVDARIDRVDAKIDALSEKMAAEFTAVRRETSEGFQRMQRLMIEVGGGIVVTLLAASRLFGG